MTESLLDRAVAAQDVVRDKLMSDEKREITPSAVNIFDDEGKRKTQTTLLIELGAQHDFFHDPTGKPFAIIKHEHHREVWPLESSAYSERLSEDYFRLTGKGCNSKSMADARATLSAIAKFQSDCREVYLRVARVDRELYIDLCDGKWRAVKVTADGWRIVSKPPVMFSRKHGMTALPEPIAGGSINNLLPFLNIESTDFVLVVGWMIGALGNPGRYAALVLQGEQGTGKSTTTRVLRELTDPSAVSLRAPPAEVRDLLVSASNTHVVALDNLSGLDNELSDALCRLCTGGGIDCRKLYTDDEQVLVELQRPIIVNGIDDIATRPDLAERSIILTLPVIAATRRRDETSFWGDFAKAKPSLFGVVLDGLAEAMKNEARVRADMLEKPRLADFAIWASAAAPAFSWGHDAFVEAFNTNQKEGLVAGLEASPIGSALLEFVNTMSEEMTHKTPSALLESLSNVPNAQVNSRAWPKSAKGLKSAITRLSPALRRLGIDIVYGRTMHERMYVITKHPTQSVPSCGQDDEVHF